MAFENIVKKVTEGGYCIGCGACAVQSDSIRMELNKLGQMIPVVDLNNPITEVQNAAIEKICAFSGQAENEDEIAQQYFGHLSKHHEIGHYAEIYAGRVKHNEYYQRGSSGGIGKWILAKLLELGHVDYVIQVTEKNNNANSESLIVDYSQPELYRYEIFSKTDEVIKGSKSAYYPIEMSEVLDFVKNNEGRYAITGVPCFIKTIRRLQNSEDVYKSRIQFTLSIVCGHLKTKGYAEMIGWQLGVEPNKLSSLDFRKKLPGKKAHQKGVQATDNKGKLSKEDIVQNLFGTNYGHGLFKYSACDYCDDVVGETSDVSVGDAWLPQYLGQGTSLTIVRNRVIGKIMQDYACELDITPITAQQAADSQRAGIRHRRDYLQYRLWLKEKAGQWFPQKRVTPNADHLSSQAQKIVKTRLELAQISHDVFIEAKQKNDFSLMEKTLFPYMELLYDLSKRPLVYRVARFLRAIGIYTLLVKIKKNK